MTKVKVGAGTAGPVGNANEIKNNPRFCVDAASTRELAGSIRDYAEAHKSSDSAWSKLKSAADAVHNGVESEISRMIRALVEIDDQAARGFQSKFLDLVEEKPTQPTGLNGRADLKPDHAPQTASQGSSSGEPYVHQPKLLLWKPKS